MLLSNEKKAYSSALKRFYSQRSFQKIYIIPCIVGRKRLYAVISEREAAENSIKTRCAVLSVGVTEEEREKWEQVRNNEDIQKCREYLRFIKADKTIRRIQEGWKNNNEE